MEQSVNTRVKISRMPFNKFVDRMIELRDSLNGKWDSVEVWSNNVDITLLYRKNEKQETE